MALSALDVVLLVMLVLAALATALSARLLMAVLALAATSAVLAAIMFRLDAPIAGVFELSVCAGLIPAIFISTIGLTRRLTAEAAAARKVERRKRFWYLPVLVIVLGLAMAVRLGATAKTEAPASEAAATAPAVAQVAPAAVPATQPSVQEVLWNSRQVDLLGQVVVLLAGAFGVVVLLKEIKSDP